MNGIPALTAGDARTFEMLEWRTAAALEEHTMRTPDGRAALCAAPIAPGAADAWVRWAWVQDGAPLRLWQELLEAQSARLRALHVHALWCADLRGSWLLHALRERGFRRVEEVVTYEAPAEFGAAADCRGDVEFGDVGDRDFAALDGLDRRAFAAPWRYPEAVLRAAQAQLQIFLAARVDGRAVGYVAAAVHDEDAHVVRLAVEPSFGRRGIGSALLRLALLRARASGARRVTLNTLKSLPAGRLYERLGFRVMRRAAIDVLQREVPS